MPTDWTLTDADLDRMAIVLVRARNPNNIGAVARAMHDFGFGRLRVVNEFPVPFEAARSAVDASSVLEGAVVFSSVAEAVADCSLVVGTTAVGERDLQHEVQRLAEAATLMRAHLAQSGDNRLALLFGSEKTGLSNEELSHCQWLLTIPMYEQAGRHLSMNLGQAVAVCLYELVRAAPGAEANSLQDSAIRLPLSTNLPNSGDLERLTRLMGEVLEEVEYTRHHPANSDEAEVRRLVLRMGLHAKDAQVWMGILRQLLWKLRR